MDVFEELLDKLEAGELSSILLNFIDEKLLRQILLEHLSEGDKESVIYSYGNEGWNSRKRATISRGTPAFVFSRDYIKRGIVTAQHIYHVSKVYTKTYLLRKRNRVVGVVIGKTFHICYHLKLQSKEEVFGYFVSNSKGHYQVQTIQGFDKFSYDAYKNSYALGEEMEINQTEISSALYDMKDMFYTEFR